MTSIGDVEKRVQSLEEMFVRFIGVRDANVEIIEQFMKELLDHKQCIRKLEDKVLLLQRQEHIHDRWRKHYTCGFEALDD